MSQLLSMLKHWQNYDVLKKIMHNAIFYYKEWGNNKFKN
jgi:hypothetical protein